MISTTRILFFIILSFVLHFLSLSLDFTLLSRPAKTQLIGIGYVSRSLDSFCPASKTKVFESEKTNELIRRKRQNIKTKFEQSQRCKLQEVRPEEIKLGVPVSGSKQVSIASRSIKISAAELPQKKLLDKVAVVKPDTIDIKELKEQLLDKERTETGLSEQGRGDQTKKLAINYESAAASKTQKDSDNISGFREALPRYDDNPPPEYPEIARRRGWQGIVQFEVLVLKSGRVGGLKMLVSTGYRSLDNAARKAINRWKFQPATSFGMPVNSRVIVPVDFVLGLSL